MTDDLRVLPPAQARGLPCAIEFEGSPVRAFEGEPLAVALFAGGITTLARSTKFHRPRGAFCFEGHCASCFLRVDGRPNIRSCMTPARPGLRCERQNFVGGPETDLLAAADWMFPDGMDHHALLTGNRIANRLLLSVVRQMGGSGTLPDAPPASRPARAGEVAEIDVCIVGGGPAGLAAAAALAGLAPRARVLLLDEQVEPGGSWLAEPQGMAHAAAASARARAAGIRLLSSATAIGFFPEDIVKTDRRRDAIAGILAVTTAAGLLRVAARRILYATGAYDQNLAFLDNDRPGIISARACGRMAFRHGVSPGHRVAVLGPAPYGDRLVAGLGAAGFRADDIHRVDPTRSRPVAALGGSAVRGLIVADPDGSEHRISADTIAVAATPAPASELARQHGADVLLDEDRGGFAVLVSDDFCTTADRVFACGDVTGYVGPTLAEQAGTAAAAAIAQTLE